MVCKEVEKVLSLEDDGSENKDVIKRSGGRRLLDST